MGQDVAKVRQLFESADAILAKAQIEKMEADKKATTAAEDVLTYHRLEDGEKLYEAKLAGASKGGQGGNDANDGGKNGNSTK